MPVRDDEWALNPVPVSCSATEDKFIWVKFVQVNWLNCQC